MESLAACGDTAASRGVMLCLEALPENLTNLLNTNAEVLAMVRQIDHPNIRMMFYVKSMCAEPISTPGNIRARADWFRYVHANDTNGMGPGSERSIFGRFWPTLAEVNYRGLVSVEVFDFTAGPEATARRSLQYEIQANQFDRRLRFQSRQVNQTP